MASPKVSIIIPVYNTEKYLKQCVDSLTSQTMEDIEIILVDDGSMAECAAYCDELAGGDSRIKVIHKENAGPGFARNAGMDIACGEYVGFVDSDDFVRPEMYESLYNAAVKYNADLVMSGVCFVGGNTFSKSGDYEEKDYFTQDTVFENDGIKNLLLGTVGALPNEPDDSRYGVSVWKNIFRRSLMSDGKIPFMSERVIMSEDAIYMVDFVKQIKKAVGIPGAFYCYRRNDESFSKSYKSDRFDKALVFLNEIEKHIKDVVTEDEYRLYLDRLVQGYARVICSQEIMYARDNKIKYSVLRSRLSRICASQRVAAALKNYPWYKLPKKQAVFAFAMKYRLYLLQKIFVLLRAR